jgi:cobalt-zinc-cadmium efflux system outer membrane protein
MGFLLLLLGARCSARETQATVPQLPAPTPATAKLTLAQALDLALKQNPQILQATYQVASARANLSSQRAPINPTLSYSGLNNTVTTGNFGNPSNYALYATIETSGRQGLRTRQARAQLQSSQFDAVTARLTVQQATASAYITLQVANSNLDSEQTAYDVAKRLQDLTERQFKLGSAPETNAIRAQIALTQEEQNLLQAINNVNIARSNLNIQLGRPPATPVDAAEPLEFHPITVQLKTLQELALRNRPEIKSAEAARHALQAAEGLERSQYYPDTIVGSTLRADAVQLGFTLPIDLGGIRNGVRKAREDVHVQEAQELQVRNQVELDVQSAFFALDVTRRTAETYQSGLVPRSKSLLDRTEQGYKLGASTILDLIDAQTTYRTTITSYNSAIGDYRQALAQLERAVGIPLTTVLK